jgi:hypothetical protein
MKGISTLLTLLGVVAGEARDVVVGDDEPVEVAELGLEQHADRVGHLVDVAQALVLQGTHVEVGVVGAVDGEG